MPATPLTLQINLVPTDAPVAEHTLPHQLRQLGRIADEVLLVVDVPPTDPPKLEAWRAQLPRLEQLVNRARDLHPNVRLHHLDPSPQARARLAELFFGGRAFPPRDFRGRPFDAYLTGISEARNDLLLHLDSDMLLGGSVEAWLDEAQRLLALPEILACSPHPGPPAPDGRLRRALGGRPDPSRPATFQFDRFTTRAFLIRRSRFLEAVCPLKTRRPAPIHAYRAWRSGNPVHRELEHLISRAMRRRGLLRLDFLGPGLGFWGLHPTYRSAHFLEVLPELVRRVETGDVPEAQQGDEEVNDSMVDWTSAREARRRRRW